MSRRPLSGLAWFAAMLAGWLAFWGLALLSEPTLAELWHGVRDLPFVLEGLVWLAVFPFVLALGIWDSGWEAWMRLALVGCCTVGWSLAFFPWTQSGPTAHAPPSSGGASNPSASA